MLYPLSYGGVFAPVNDKRLTSNYRRARLVRADLGLPSAAWLAATESFDEEDRCDDCGDNGHDDCDCEDVTANDSAGASDFGNDECDFTSGQHA